MDAEIQDANPTAESSSVVNVDVNKTTESSSVETPETKKTEKTIADVVQETYDKATEKDSSPEKVEGQESEVQGLNPTDEKKEETVEKEETESEDKKEELPPFHEHPRWKEIVADRDSAKAELERLQPVVQAHVNVSNFCQKNNITAEEYNEVLQMAALAKNDPIAFHSKLKDMVAQMAPDAGDALSPELQKAVDDGEITLPWAQKLAKQQAQGKFAQQKAKLSVEQQAANAQQQFVNNIKTALSTWEQSTAKNDPDFVEGSPKYKWFMAELSSQIVKTDIKTANDAVVLAVKAYEMVNENLGKVIPKNGATRKPLSSTKSSTTAPKKPTTIAEVVRATAAKHGL